MFHAPRPSCDIGGTILVLLLGLACSAPIGPTPAQHAPPRPEPEIEAPYQGDGFTLSPPLGWLLEQAGKDWRWRPPDGDVEARTARAQIVATFEQLAEEGQPQPQMDTPEAFMDACLAALLKRDPKPEVKPLGSGRTDSGALFAIVEMLLQTDRGRSRHRFHNFYLPSGGYWRISLSSWAGYWPRLEPLMALSVNSFIPKHAPKHGRNRPPSMRENEFR